MSNTINNLKLSKSPKKISIFIRFFLIIFLTCINQTTAKLPFNAFFGVTDCLKPGYEHLSPTIGMAALDASLIYDLRMFGDFEKGYKKDNQNAYEYNPFGERIRIYIQDSSTSSVWNIVKILFPSNTGGLDYEITNPTSFSQNVKTPVIIALLLNYITDLRENPEDQWEDKSDSLRKKVKEYLELEFKNSLDPDPKIQFEKDRVDVEKNKQVGVDKVYKKLTEMVTLTTDKLSELFVKKDNKNDDFGIWNDIVFCYQRNRIDTKKDIDAIVNDVMDDTSTKITKIIDVMRKNFGDEYIEGQSSKIPSETAEGINATIDTLVGNWEKMARDLESPKKQSKSNKIQLNRMLTGNSNFINYIRKKEIKQEMENIVKQGQTNEDIIKSIKAFMIGHIDAYLKYVKENDPRRSQVTQMITNQLNNLTEGLKKLVFINTKNVLEVIAGATDSKEAGSLSYLTNDKDVKNKITSILLTSENIAVKIEKIMNVIKESLETMDMDKETIKFQDNRQHKNDGFIIDQSGKPGTFTQMMNHLKQSVKEELNAPSPDKPLYPKYTPEQIILAFFCMKFNTQDDIKLLFRELHKLNPNIIDETKIDDMRLMKQADIETIEKDIPYNLDSVFNLQNAINWMAPSPYKSGIDLISNGTTYQFDRKLGTFNKSMDTFQDCVEIGLRHFMNLMLYDYQTKVFDLSSISNYVQQNDPQNPYFKNFVDFYTYQTPTKVEETIPETRSLWNKVVGDLNAIIPNGRSTPHIRYLERDIGNIQRVDGTIDNLQNEVDAGFVNFIRVCQKIFGLKFNHGDFKEDDTPQNKINWLTNSFAVLMNALVGNSKLINLDISKLEITPDKKDIQGFLGITVYSADRHPLFSFTFQSHPSMHSGINNHKYLVQINNSNAMANLKKNKSSLKENTTDEVLWLMNYDYTLQQKVQAPLYKIYNRKLNGNTEKVEFLHKFNDTSNLFRHVPISFLNTIVKNVIDELPLSDAHTIIYAAPFILTLLDNKNFDLQDIMKYVSIRGSFGNIPNALMQMRDTIKLISRALKANNRSLITLNLTNNNIRIDDLKILLEGLKTNSSLKKLFLDQNKIFGHYGITEEAEKVITNLLQHNFQAISFNSCEFDYEGAVVILKALRDNDTLQYLGLRNNTIKDEGAIEVAEILKRNTTLQTLDLGKNEILDSGVKALAESLKVNKTLLSLFLSNDKVGLPRNRIGAEGGMVLEEALKANNTLRELDLTHTAVWGYNYENLEPFKASGRVKY